MNYDFSPSTKDYKVSPASFSTCFWVTDIGMDNIQKFYIDEDFYHLHSFITNGVDYILF